MNFTFQRNPQRLLDLCGFSAIRDRQEEKAFLAKARTLDNAAFRPLLLVVGGFIDQILGNSYAVSARCPADLRERHDIWFREHYEGRRMRELVAFYAAKGQPICLVGHSWGGDAVVNAVARKVDAPIDLLITLDPVSRKGPPRQRLANVRHWLNIYIDYSRSAWFDIPNIVARIGGPWEGVACADTNIACPPDITHAWAWGMFERYGEAVLRDASGGKGAAAPLDPLPGGLRVACDARKARKLA